LKQLLQVRSTLLTLFVVGFVTLFSVGCGSSSDNSFVATGTSNQAPTNGTLVFNLQKANPQQVTTVPADTTTVRIDLYTASDSLESSVTLGYQNEIVLEDVSPSVVRADLLALNGDGLPVRKFSQTFTLNPGEAVEVSFDDGQPVSFEGVTISPNPVNLLLNAVPEMVSEQQVSLTGKFDGATYYLPIDENVVFEVANPLVANVSADGLVSVLNAAPNQPASSSILSATYNFLGTEQVGTATIDSRFFAVAANGSTVIPAGDSFVGNYGFAFFDSNGQQVQISGVTFALETPVEGVVVDPATGQFSTTAQTPPGQFTIIATWVDDERAGATGLTFTSPVFFTVVDIP